MQNKICRIAFVLRASSKFGGAERRLTRVFSMIDGLEILVCSLESKQKVQESLMKFSEHNPKCIICYNKMSDLLKKLWKEKYDYVIYFDSSGRMLPVPIIARLSGSKRLWVLADVKMSNMEFKNIKDRIIFNIFRLFADRVDCLYPGRIKKLKQKMAKDIRITETPLPFTDTNIFIPMQKEKTIIFASRLIEGKGVLEFLDAIVRCKSKMRELGYISMVCGEGKLKDKVIKSIRFNEIEDLLELKGYCEMEHILPYARIFMSLQEFENYPSQSLLEAISSGCWCIATDVGNTQLLVKPDFGELVKGNSIDIAEAILNAMSKTENEFEQISVNARRFAETNFNLRFAVDYYNKIFNE